MYEIGKLDQKKISAFSSGTSKSKIKSPKLRLFALYENLTRFVMPLCSSVPGRSNPETPVDQSNNIIDISKVGLKQFWNLRSHMQEASTLATAHYPEILDRIFVSSQLRFSGSAGMLIRAFKGHWRTLILPRRLGLGQEVVRPHHYLKDIHPRTA